MAKVYIIMGVSGCGKSTVGEALAQRTGIPFYDADDYHPTSNVAKMASGQPLNDTDRQPWLERLAQLLAQTEQTKTGAILACSALKAHYRTTLASQLQNPPTFVYLAGNFSTIAARMRARTNHFMPESLLYSQFDTLEVPTNAITVPITLSVDEQLTMILSNE